MHGRIELTGALFDTRVKNVRISDPDDPTVQEAPLMAGDSKPKVSLPLTSGFARTGYEHDRAIAESVESAHPTGQK